MATPSGNTAKPPTDSPKDPGKEVVFRHLDDAEVPWQKVRAQRNADGSESFVHEKWLAFSPEPQYLSLYAKYDPGMIVRKHGHFSPHIVFVLEGSVTCGDRECPAGTHIELPFGAAFGPIIAGDEGTAFLEITNGDFRSWGDQPELYQAEIAARGVTPLPDPEITNIGDWFEDKRSFWTPPADG